MKWSEVIGPAFFRIHLSAQDRELLDIHFSGAAHHYARWLEADGIGPAEFHQVRFFAHLRHLMLLVYEKGDFLVGPACDASLRGLERRDRWNPDAIGNDIPDPMMFDGLQADPQFPVGIPHDLDQHLKDLFAPRGMRLAPTHSVRAGCA